MTEYIIYWLIGLTVSLNFVTTFFHSNISAHISNLIFKLKGEDRLFTRADFEDFSVFRFSSTVSDFLSCKLCVSHWVSLAASMVVAIFTGFWVLPILGMFTYPVIIFWFDAVFLKR